MIETTVLNYLKSKLSVPAYMEIPKNAPDRYVIIEKVGSSFENRLDTATMVFQSYAPTLEKAALLNEEVKAVVESMVELSAISNCYLNGDNNFTDTSIKGYRYQALYVITYLREV